ncbi:hypothetical protein, partial [Paraburkholderia terricola]|uniref:hypothetical protein n=1 Tax=Paraburkholderia terricola TaxID=169427 RepID=UPI00286A4A80
FDMADWLRQSKRAHHALEKSASGNGRAESLTIYTLYAPLKTTAESRIGGAKTPAHRCKPFTRN